MKKEILILLLPFFFLMPSVTADDITLSVDQSEYYFLTGQNALIPLTMNNTYDDEIKGLLTYTITQTVNQGGSTFSSSNSQSQSFTIPNGNNTIQINFGKSNQPMKLEADLEFSFSIQDETRIVTLEDIIIYFVSNQSQLQNQQNPMQSSSEQITNAEPSQHNQQHPQTPQEKLQNNQMNQDSQALKKQIKQQLAEEQAEQEAFKNNLFNNSDFQNQHQSLQKQGYNLSTEQINAKDNDTGDFNFTYKNEQGETATFQGTMTDGELTHYQKQTAEDKKELFEILNQSNQFQQYHKQLRNESYNRTHVSYELKENKTTMNLTYQNNENKTATITAEFFDTQLQDVTLSKQDSIHLIFWLIPLFIIGSVSLILLYYYHKKIKDDTSDSTRKNLTKPFNYKKEAARLLSEAELLYKQAKYKEAFGKAGQSLRLFLSYEHGLRKEITNEDILRFLADKKYPYHEIKRCFNLCSLVEFAKYNTNETDFKQVYKTVKTIIAQT